MILKEEISLLRTIKDKNVLVTICLYLEVSLYTRICIIMTVCNAPCY